MNTEKLKVLLIEDDRVDQMAFKRWVKNNGQVYDYRITGSVAETLKNLESERYDVIIADYNLGDGTAFDVLGSGINTPMIFVTGGGNEEIAIKAMKAGAHDYLIKDKERNYLKVLPLTVENAVKHKRAEIALKESEEKYRELVDNAIVGVFKTNLKGEILYVNDAALGICEFNSLQELKNGGVLPRYKNPDDRKILLKKLKENGKISGFEFEILTNIGNTGHILLNATLSDDIISGMILDITSRKAMENENKKIQAKLLQAQKMEAIGVLAGGIAHDFNNILTTIQGCAEIAIMDLNQSHPLYEDLAQIQLSADRAANLTRQLLLFSREHPMELKPINLNNTINDLLKMLKRIIGEDIIINIDLAPDIWTIKADQGSLEQLIMNLAINARDAMPAGGQITIRMENHVIEKSLCMGITQIKAGRYICFSVIDTGSGMDKEVLEHIFDPFYSTKAPGKGTGLGLSVVYGIVKQHGGGIQVKSELGHGSEFNIFFPSIISCPQGKADGEISITQYKGMGEKILIVEDEEDVRQFTKKALNKFGYEVSTATNAEEAIDIFNKDMDKFSMVLSDVVLPGKSGIELVDELLVRKPDLRVLLCSGYTDHMSQYPLIVKKGFKFLQKPYTLANMLQSIREVITSHQDCTKVSPTADISAPG